MSPDEDFWSRFERSARVYAGPLPAPAAPIADNETAEDGLRTKRSRRRMRRGLDIVAVAVWTWLVLKVFVFDIDHAILGGLAKYRLLLTVGAVFLLSLALRSHLLVGGLYVMFFPLILVFWRVPWFLYQRKSWLPVVALVNILMIVGHSLLRKVILGSLYCLSAAALALSHSRTLVAGAITMQLTILTMWYVQVFRQSLRPSQLSRLQDRYLERILASDSVILISKAGLEMKSQEVELFSKSEVDTFAMQLSVSVVTNRALYFWAYQLDRYRRSAASLLTASVQYIGLLTGSGVTFTLVNIALHRVRPNDYSIVGGSPGVVRFALYSMASLALNAAGGIDAVGDASAAVRLAAGLLGPVILLGLLISSVMNFRLTRDDQKTDATVTLLKARAAEQEARMRLHFNVSVDDAIDRLNSIGSNLTAIAGFMISSIPSEFFSDKPPPTG